MERNDENSRNHTQTVGEKTLTTSEKDTQPAEPDLNAAACRLRPLIFFDKKIFTIWNIIQSNQKIMWK